jgi:hypothetical protein
MTSLLNPPDSCFPWWHTQFAAIAGRGNLVINSGCSTIGGNVQCDPEAMRAKAEATLRAAGYNLSLSLPAYTLARYIAAEVGSGTPEEKVAVAQAAINRTRLEKLRDINSLLLYRQASGHPNRGRYGPIHLIAADETRTSPYGRWAATSRDPSVQDVAITSFVLAGGAGDFARGADDQDGPEGLDNPVRKVQAQALRRDYWVGPLPGVDHWHTFLYRYLPDVAPDSDLGQWLTARGVAALASKARPNWAGYQVCEKPSGVGTLFLLAGAGAGAYYGYRWWRQRQRGLVPAL